MDTKFPEIGRNAFDEWCWKRGLELRTLADELEVSTETVRLIRLPFTDPRRRVPNGPLAERIFTLTGGAVRPADFYPPEFRGDPTARAPEGAAI